MVKCSKMFKLLGLLLTIEEVFVYEENFSKTILDP